MMPACRATWYRGCGRDPRGADPQGAPGRAVPIVRWKNVALQRINTGVSRAVPLVKKLVPQGWSTLSRTGYDVRHPLKPSNNLGPADSASCPTGDIFKSLSDGSADIVTDRDEPSRGRDQDRVGRELRGRVVVTRRAQPTIPSAACGWRSTARRSKVEAPPPQGDDGSPSPETWPFKIGYNPMPSWTLKDDMVAEYCVDS